MYVDSSKNKEKIGKFVQRTFPRLFKENKLSDSEINKLMDSGYSKRTFGLSYPVLKIPEVNSEVDRKRYYSNPIFNNTYLLCNDWYDRNYDNLKKWVFVIENR